MEKDCGHESFKLHTIEEAIQDIRDGKVIIVVDSEDRENEGDFICAAELVTPEIVNFMATHGRGLICAAITEDRCAELDLSLMVGKNTSSHETPFTVSVDLIGRGCTTGVSASDRSKTIQALVSKDTVPADLARPGHIFPLKAKNRGVLRRAGHTEAAVDLARLAGLAPAGVLVEIMNEDGSMARLPQLVKVGQRFGMKIISIADLIAYLLKTESLVEMGPRVPMPTEFGLFDAIPFRQVSNGLEHLALVKGSWAEDEPIFIRVHSSCATGDIFHSQRCDCGAQLHTALQKVNSAGKGVVLYMSQEGRGIGLFNKLLAYKLQDEGLDTVQANIELGFREDERDYGVGAQILRKLGVSRMKLMTNNPTKRAGLEGYGLYIEENVPLEIAPNTHNEFYLKTKKDKMGHELRKLCH
jgi:3,4-dihydroxy 2-butanone 4-phosphate synthase / GTP cyclohydrolase II